VPFCRQTPLTVKALRARDYSENPQTVGEHLKKRCRQLGLLQREAADQMGIGVETYANWEKGKTEPAAAQFRPVVAFLATTRRRRPRRLQSFAWDEGTSPGTSMAPGACRPPGPMHRSHFL